MLAPDLKGISFGSKNVLAKNQHMITLGGIAEAESQEDLEAQRNRNINLNDLQSLLA